MAENRYYFAIVYIILALIFAGAYIKPKIKMQWAVGIIILVPFLMHSISSNTAYYNTSVFESSMIKYNNPGNYYNGSKEKTNRVDYTQVNVAHSGVLNMINNVMESDETYIDLTSQTMFYALSGKEKPVYINQSPLHLSGEYSQEQFIYEIEDYGDKCAFALLGGNWTQLDGIEISLKYYKIYEYLNEEFRPLCKDNINQYSLWVRKDRYEDVLNKISEFINEPLAVSPNLLTDTNHTNGIRNDNKQIVCFTGLPESVSNFTQVYIHQSATTIPITSMEFNSIYTNISFPDETSAALVSNSTEIIFIPPISLIDYSTDNHSHNYSLIGYLWGEYDTKKAYEKNRIQDLTSNSIISIANQSNSNYILLEINSSSYTIAKLNFTKQNGQYFSFDFNVQAGKHKYLIRCSTDSYWNQEDLTITLTSLNSFSLDDFALLQGD